MENLSKRQINTYKDLDVNNVLEKITKKRVSDTKSFITEAIKIHGNKYNYDRVDYQLCNIPVTITCPIHGEFDQIPSYHLQGNGCPKCSGKYKPSTEEFIEKARKIHGDKYDYSKVNYINCETKICIICPEHGEFWQTPNHHINAKCGCQKCNESKGEREVRAFLKENNIYYIDQFIVQVPTTIRRTGITKIDFYLPDYKTFIEYNGKQHYIPQKAFGGEIRFNEQIRRDNYIRNYCRENNIKLIELMYTDKDFINTLKNELHI